MPTKFEWVVLERVGACPDDDRRTVFDSTEEAHSYLREHGYRWDIASVSWVKCRSDQWAVLTRKRKDKE